MGTTNALKVGELKQDLDNVLLRVRSGEQFQITDDDKPVAILAPVPPDVRSLLDGLVASGQMTAPKLDLLDLGPPLVVSSDISISEALRQQREERLR